MKAITIKQPWASLICVGIKDIENRTWRTNFRGRVLIHAGACEKLDRLPLDVVYTIEQLNKLKEYWSEYELCKQTIPKCAIAGSVEIVDCVVNHPSIWAEKTTMVRTLGADGLFKLVPEEKPVYNWILANPVLFENPILNVKGRLSFWDYAGIKEVTIKCPNCGSSELAIEDYSTIPFPTYYHKCKKCGYDIMESEWD